MWGGNIHPSLKFLASEYHDFPWPENIWKKKKIFFVEEWKNREEKGGRYYFIFDGLVLGLESLPAIVNCAFWEKDNLTTIKNGCTDEYGDIWFKKLRGQL